MCSISGSQFTSVVYPQPLVLSAGTSYTLPITFRPCEKVHTYSAATITCALSILMLAVVNKDSSANTCIILFLVQNCYQEHIEIETNQGIFQVPIRAQLPKSDLALPDSLKLGMCAVQESVTVNFEVSNIR